MCIKRTAHLGGFCFDYNVICDTITMNERHMIRTVCACMAVLLVTSAYADVASRANVRGTMVADSTANISRETSSRRSLTAPNQNVRRNMISRAISGVGEEENVENVQRRNNSALVARTGTTQNAVHPEQTTSGSINAGRVAARAAARSPVVSVSSSNSLKTTSEVVKEVKAGMSSLADLTSRCREQYNACMDNFCNVLDEKQARCSCNKNIKNYEKTETALKSATEELQEVAQKIQYIGLTEKEITTLFTETAAENAMQTNSDTTKLRNDLDRIKSLIVGVKSGSASAVTDNSGISLDLSNLLSFNIDSTGFDITSLFSTTGTNTSPIMNQRGEALYKSAAARCKSSVLNTCSSYGVDIAAIINSYDVNIDKDCVAYERYLKDSNEQMVSTIRNAKTVLQKARLMVAQQKNQYDMRGCISALDSCMQDDYVCGTDYEECLDPSGRYIVNGEIVVGSEPGVSGGTYSGGKATGGLYTTWNVGNDNMWAPSSTYTISKYISDDGRLSLANAQNSTSEDMLVYLQNKIGYHADDGKNYGMCMSVLNKCQKETYENGQYNPKNSVIASYMLRALRQIKSSQDKLLQNYAHNCLADVQSCLTQNGNTYFGGQAGSSTPSDIAIKACLPVIKTCRSVTLGISTDNIDVDNLENIYAWLNAGIGTEYTDEVCSSGGGVYSESANGCVCTNKGDRWEWKTSSNTCGCKSQYELYQDACVTSVEKTCLESGGSLNNGQCVCSGSNKVLVDNAYCGTVVTQSYSASATRTCKVQSNYMNMANQDNFCSEDDSYEPFEWSVTENGTLYKGLSVCTTTGDYNINSVYSYVNGVEGSSDCWCVLNKTGGYKWVHGNDVGRSYASSCQYMCPHICSHYFAVKGNDDTGVRNKLLTEF